MPFFVYQKPLRILLLFGLILFYGNLCTDVKASPPSNQGLIPVQADLYPHWVLVTDVIQGISAALLSTEVAMAVNNQVAGQSNITAIVRRVVPSTAIAGFTVVQSHFAAQCLKSKLKGAAYPAGMKHFHFITNSFAAAGFLVLYAGVASNLRSVMISGILPVDIFLLSQALTLNWKAPDFGYTGKWQVISGNTGGIIIAGAFMIPEDFPEVFEMTLIPGISFVVISIIPALAGKIWHLVIARQPI